MLIEIVGWAGAIAVLAAYALLSMGRLHGRSLVYQLTNIGGALGMTINGLAHAALPSVFTNVVWMLVGLITLVRLFTLRARPRAPAC